MKIGTKIALWTVGIIAVIILPDANLYYQRYKLKVDKLPEVYKSYSTLDSLNDELYEVLKVDGGKYNPVSQLNDSTIMITNSTSEETEDGSREERDSWYKINLKGQITDSLKYAYNDRKQNHNYQTFYNYVVDVYGNTFNTWILNNDSSKKSIKNLNENKIFSVDEAKRIISAHEYLYHYRIQADSGENNTKIKLLIYKNGVFNYLYTDKNFYPSTYYSQDFGEIKYEVNLPDNNSGIMTREYVKKDEWVGHTFWDSRTFSYGSGNGSGRIGWYGTSYYDVKMPKKIVHFKDRVEIEYPDEGVRNGFEYNIYKPKNGEYLMLSDIQNSRNYIIRPKRK